MSATRHLRSFEGFARRFKKCPHQACRATFSTSARLELEAPVPVSGPPLSSQPPPDVSLRSVQRLAQQQQDADVDPEAPDMEVAGPRLPRNVQAVYLRPLKRRAEYGVPCCDLQLRSYSVRNLEFFADFALRVAYYLNLPASGPVPLPRITERWTVPRSNFVHKKSQENFERITMRRLIQLQDSHPDSVELWLSYLQKYQYYGVGMKANVWEYETLDVAKAMDEKMESVKKTMESRWPDFGNDKIPETGEGALDIMHKKGSRPGALGTRIPY